jgi:PPIC-type PPIASE domain
MKALIALLVAVAAGVLAAALAIPNTAATINGTAMSQATLNEDLAAIANSPAYQCYLEASTLVASQGQSAGPPVQGVGGAGTYANNFVQTWLNTLINAEIFRQVAAARNVTVSQDQIDAARADYVASVDSTLQQVSGSQFQCPASGASTVASMPTGFVERQVAAQAAFEGLVASIPGYGVSPSDLTAYYDAHQSSFNTLCVSGIVVASQATATTVRNQIVAGTPFAQAAQQSSTDPTGAKGGVLGCFAPGEQGYSAYANALSGLKVGDVTQPIQGQSGYILLQLTSSTPNSLSSEAENVRHAILQAGSSEAGQLVQAAVRHATVTVDPQYGVWVSHGSNVGLFAPATPPLNTLISASANQPR